MTGDLFEPGKLPSAEERRIILERARRVVSEARAILEQLDASQGRLPLRSRRPGSQELFTLTLFRPQDKSVYGHA